MGSLDELKESSIPLSPQWLYAKPSETKMVQTLNNPSVEEFHKVLDSFQPSFVYLQGEQLSNDEVGSLVWGGVALSTTEAISGLFGSTLPNTVRAWILYHGQRGGGSVKNWKSTCTRN
ncbi:AT-rich interactive domain-containing protein 4-like [Cornus florida]|uniref:AT-rich interactive domain-containing protein 4-like n=1 Tax=Cornus florida TaxID=4283 RepID=UPI002898116C|nr:AT-rich interactive domain-containing protein 4-like [Cornus florida]